MASLTLFLSICDFKSHSVKLFPIIVTLSCNFVSHNVTSYLTIWLCNYNFIYHISVVTLWIVLIIERFVFHNHAFISHSCTYFLCGTSFNHFIAFSCSLISYCDYISHSCDIVSYNWLFYLINRNYISLRHNCILQCHFISHKMTLLLVIATLFLILFLIILNMFYVLFWEKINKLICIS